MSASEDFEYCTGFSAEYKEILKSMGTLAQNAHQTFTCSKSTIETGH